MKRVGPSEKENALIILREAFRNNDGARWIIKKDNRDEQRMTALCRFCLDVSMQKSGAYISTDRHGVVLVFNNRAKLGIINFLANYFHLGNDCIGWSRALSIINRETTIRGRRPKTNHLYCWMIGTRDVDDLSTIKEVRDFMFDLSAKEQLPIVAETTSERALQLYQRYGFNIYDQWHVATQNLTVWFIIRHPG